MTKNIIRLKITEENASKKAENGVGIRFKIIIKLENLKNNLT